MAIGRSEAKHMLLPILQRNLKYGYSVLAYPSLVWSRELRYRRSHLLIQSLESIVLLLIHQSGRSVPLLNDHSKFMSWSMGIQNKYRARLILFQSLASFLWGCDLATVSVLPPQYLYQSTFPAARLCVSHSYCLLVVYNFSMCVLRSKSLYVHF